VISRGLRRWLPVAGLAGGGFALAAGIEFVSSLGPLSAHMSTHILLMNVLAPLLALALVSGGHTTFASGRSLAAASAIQLVALWGVHAPATWGMASPAAHLLLQGLLFATALGFWWAVMAQPPAQSWRALFALLVTGKLFCLLGALLVFAPRALYPGLAAAHAHPGHAGPGGLEDQQLAGLLMLLACPLSYVLAGIVIAARWLRTLAGGNRAAAP
jgi:putative membrane protein